MTYRTLAGSIGQRAIWSVLLAWLFVAPCLAAPEAFQNADAALAWMREYVQHPQPDRVPAAIEAVAAALPANLPAGRTKPLVRLFAAVLKDRPETLQQVAAMAPQTAAGQSFVAAIVSEARDYPPVVIRDPGDLDLIVMDYLATGSEQDITQLIALATDQNPPLDLTAPFWAARQITDITRARMIMRVTAAWALASQVQAHPSARTWVANAMDRQPDPAQKKMLQEVLSNSITVPKT